MNPAVLNPVRRAPKRPVHLYSDGEPVVMAPGEVISFPALFGNANPVEVEIGCGKSRFLIDRALKNPGINFLGLDYAEKWLGIGAMRGKKMESPNLRFLKGEAFELLKDLIARQSVSVFHIYFPDPWPKRRHENRRLLRKEFFRILFDCLIEGGKIEIATDENKYFAFLKKEIASADLEWGAVRESVNERLFAGEKTHYEAKFEASGKALHYLELEKKSAAQRGRQKT